MGNSYVAASTFPSFQSANESVTLTLPGPYLSATRTVSCRRGPQHRSRKVNSTLTGGAPGFSGGNSSTARGHTSCGMVV
jgi:hypothetical protein